MSSINRQSVREEAERLKAQFATLSASKKMDTEVVMLFQSLLMLVNLLIAIFLEKTTKKDNKNSIFEKVVEHVEAQVKVCPSCDATVKGQFPSDMPGALQYGNGLKAYVINLIIGQMVSLNRVQKLVQSMIGEMLSQTTFLKFIVRLYEALEAWV